MRLVPHAVGLAVLVAAATAAVPASAQTDDPEQGSPSGVIYEIPLDNARRDAAPSGGGGDGSGGGGSSADGGGNGAPVSNATSGGSTSPIRSENGFGSSSQVPGVSAAAAKRVAEGGKRGSGAKSSGRKTVPATIPPAESLGATRGATIAPSPSKSRAYVLLGLALAVAAGVGVAGRYVARRR